MAKTKTSRRTRRQESEKQQQNTDSTPVAEETTPAVEASPAPQISNKSVNFAQEYFHIRSDLRNMIIVAVALFAVMVGFLYLI